MDNTLIDLGSYETLAAIGRADPMVSQLDSWSETVWHLDGHLPGYSAATINWEFDAPEGLIDVLKLVAVDLFHGEHPRYAHRTSRTFGRGIKYLAAFMLENDYDDLGELDEGAFERFRDALTRTVSRPSENPEAFIQAVADEQAGPESDDEPVVSEKGADEVYADEQGSVEEQGDPLTISIARTRLYAWTFLHEARETLARFEIDSCHYPFATSNMWEQAIAISKKGLDDVEPLPDAVAIPILNAAAQLIQAPADDVIRLRDDFLRTLSDPTLGSVTRIRALRSLVGDFEFSPLIENGPPWCAPIQIPTDLGTGSYQISRLIRRIHMAALVMLLAGTGMRISEICSIEVDEPGTPDALPSCIKTNPSLTETSEHFKLHGFLSKGQGKPRPRDWLLGARPMKAHAEPATVRAVRVLDRLFAPFRRMAGSPGLRRQLQVSLNGNGLPKTPGAIRWIRASTLTNHTRDFYAGVGLKELLKEAAKQDPRLQAYAESNGRCIHHHQWRHTYYEFMVRLDPELLPAVSLHFKHTSLAATENGYGSKDASVREAKDSVRVRETVRFFTRRRFGEVAPVGNMSKELERERAALERMVGDIPGADAEERVEKFVLSQDLRVWPAEHGSCLFAANPTEGRCRQVNGTADFRAGSPDFTTRTPSLCCGCPNFSVGKENIPFWRNRYIENQTAWIESHRNPLFRVSLRNAVQSAAMLRHLGEPIPLILRKPIRASSNRSKPNSAKTSDSAASSSGGAADTVVTVES